MATIEKVILKSGKPSYCVRYSVYDNGTRKQRERNFRTKKEANDFAVKTENAIRTGMYADARGLTLGEWLDMWFTTYTVNLRPNTRKGYSNHIRTINASIGKVRLDGITTATIQKFYNKLLETEYRPAKFETVNDVRVMVKPARTYAPKFVRNLHAVLKTSLDQARREGLIARNPADDTKIPTGTKIEYTVPEPEKLQELLTELQGADCYLVILTCALLACRRGEALGLYWSDIDFKENTVSIKRALIVNNLENKVEVGALKTKNAERVLPLPSVLRDLLLSLRSEREAVGKKAGRYVVQSPFVFTTVQGTPFRPDSITQAFKRAAVKVGLSDMRLHDLRHTGITYMLIDGADPKTVSGFVGHATAQFTLNQYAHVMEKAKKRAGEILENKVLLPAKT